MIIKYTLNRYLYGNKIKVIPSAIEKLSQLEIL